MISSFLAMTQNKSVTPSSPGMSTVLKTFSDDTNCSEKLNKKSVDK